MQQSLIAEMKTHGLLADTNSIRAGQTKRLFLINKMRPLEDMMKESFDVTRKDIEQI